MHLPMTDRDETKTYCFRFEHEIRWKRREGKIYGGQKIRLKKNFLSPRKVTFR